MKNKNKKTKKEITANEFTNIADIRGNALFTKDNLLFYYVKIEPVSVTTMSKQEIRLLKDNLTAEFKGERKEIRFYKIPRNIDMSNLIDDYQKQKTESVNPIRSKLLSRAISFLHNSCTSGEVLENQYYLVLYDVYEKALDLEKRAIEYKNRLSNCGIKSEICSTEQITFLCNLFINPKFAYTENVDMLMEEDFISSIRE